MSSVRIRGTITNINIYHKCKVIKKVGIYLRISTLHAIIVALVLDQVTGNVSPKLHICFDSGLCTVK